MAWVCGLWFVRRASRTSRAACLLKINKQVYLSSNLKSLFTRHRKPETVTAVFISGLDAMWQVREKPPKFDASLFISYRL